MMPRPVQITIQLSLLSGLVTMMVSLSIYAQNDLGNDPKDDILTADEASLPDAECQPPCRGIFLCDNGVCITPCRSVCSPGMVCDLSGKCISRSDNKEIPQTVPVIQDRRPKAAAAAVSSDDIALLAALEEERRLAMMKKRDRIRRFAVLVNPLALATSLPLYSFVSIPLNLQFGWRYAGLDILLTGIFGEIMGMAGEMGVRLTPQGRGLSGFYIIPRGGILAGDIDTTFFVSMELGYAWIIGAFALNLGAGAGYSSVIGLLPLGNVSFGFAI